MKHTNAKRMVTTLLCIVMLLSVVPTSAFASIANWDTENVTYSGTTFGTNGYYNVISKKDYTLVPGAATETEMVLNNSAGTRRQVIHVIEVDPSNPDVSILPGYYNIDKLSANPADASAYKAAGVTDVAKYYDTTLGYQVVGAMNTDLDYTDNAPRVLVYNGQILSGYAGAAAPKSVLYVWNNDDEISCQVCPYVKSELEAGVASGNLLHAISVSFAMVVNDGKLVSKEERTSSAAARSMVGVKEDGTLVIVMNDGRGANNSVGFCDYEEGECMLALGCKWAANCDGGGSSSFVTRRAGEEDLVCRCVPCDGAERPTKSSIIIASNVAPTGILDTVNIESDYDIFAPNTTYTFGTTAVDTHGYAMELPQDAVWALSDDAFGTIENGTFVSNGKIGSVNVQVVSGGVVFGEKEIQIANPTTLSFTQASTVLPYGKSTTLAFNSFIGEAEVYLDGSSFELSMSNTAAGTLNGLVFTATKDETIANTVITAKYVPTGAKLTFTVNFGKGSEIVWDFEDGDLHGFLGQDDAFAWQQENGINAYAESAIYTGGNMSTCITENTFIATKENGGQVHDGEKALGLTIDMTQVDFNQWVYANIYNVEGVKVLRDTANGNNATTFGMWVYIPYGFYTVENAGAMAIRFDFMAGKDAASAVRTNFNGAYKGKNVNSLTESDIPDNRWIYVTTSLAGYNYVRTQDPANGKDGYSPDLARMYVKPSVAQTLTYYFDDFTIDYSSAVDDRVPPTISNPQYATADTNIPFIDGVVITDISAAYTATISDDNSGIDPTTAAIYIDGNKVTSTKVVGNTMFCDNVSLGVGTHKVKFEIADKLGNYTTLTRTIASNCDVSHMRYRTRIELTGHNDSGESPMPGSVYYIDVTSNYSDAGVEAVFTLALSTANTWELDHIIKGDGVEFTYAVNPCKPNEVTFSLTSPTAKGALLSIPVRVYNPLLNNGTSDGTSVTVSGKSFKAPLSVELTSCKVFESYGNYEKFSVAELDAVRKIVRHEHDAHAVEDKPATCTEAGYTGRTYCDVCRSIVDWGTEATNGGHAYELVGDKFICSECGDEYDYSGTTGLLQVSGKTYYAIAGKLVSGWQGIDDDLYYFGVDYAAVNGNVTINNRNYGFEDYKLVRGAWVELEGGKAYFWGNECLNTCWSEIDGYTYHFDVNGFAATGYTPVAQGRNSTLYHFDDEGRLIEAIDYVDGIYFADNGEIYYFVNGYLSVAGLVKYGDCYYYFPSTYKALKNADRYIDEAGSHGYVAPGTYHFNADGCIILSDKNGPQADGCFYLNGIRQSCYQLVKYDGNYYFINDGHKIAKDTRIYLSGKFIEGTDFVAGYYEFDADGKLVTKNGPQADGYFYLNGVRQSCYQLVKYDGDYYFINDGHKIAKDTRVYLSGKFIEGTDFVAGYYEFDTDGKLIIKNGPQADGYFYLNGVRQNCYQLVEYQGSYYFINDGHKITKNRRLFLSDTYVAGTSLSAGYYNFGADGKMLKSYENLIAGVTNTRDIGNWAAADGKVIKTGLLIRGSELDGAINSESVATNEGIAYLTEDFGVKMQIDLRSPLCGGSDVLGKDVSHVYFDAPAYEQIATEFGKNQMKLIFTELANLENYPIYMNCTYGIDRTGTVCYILEAILGVSSSNIVAEYSYSASYRTLNAGMIARLNDVLNVYAGNTINEKAEAYLIDCGVTAEQIASIRAIFLE